MKKQVLILLFLVLSNSILGQKSLQLTSPDGNIRIGINFSDHINYSISYLQETLLENCTLGMQIGNEVLGTNPQVTRTSRKSISETITPVVPLKYTTVDNHYNQLLLKFRGGYSIEFRAFDNGFAYRFITDRKGIMEVKDETFGLHFPGNYLLHMQQPRGFKTSYEEEYRHVESKEWKESDHMALLPLLIDTRKNCKILFSESDLSDYPGMFLKSWGENNVKAVFPHVPLEFGEDGDRSQKILKEADYIARTEGKRNFPWRYFVIAPNDGDLIENTMNLQLAEKMY